MSHAGNWAKMCLYGMICLFISCFFGSYASAQNKVVVIPLFSDELTCTGTLSPGRRWCDQGNGTVMDMTTSLVWLKKADWGGLKPWRNSSTDCSSPNYTCYDDAHTRAGILKAGASGAELSDASKEGDWRLPTSKELFNLMIGTEGVTASTPQLFTGVQTFYYWCSGTYTYDISRGHWGVVDPGGIPPFDDHKTNEFYVWPVRGGN